MCGAAAPRPSGLRPAHRIGRTDRGACEVGDRAESSADGRPIPIEIPIPESSSDGLVGATGTHACATVAISETCDRYQGKRVDENAEVADWLVRLTTANRPWGFGLCFLELRNIKHFP